MIRIPSMGTAPFASLPKVVHINESSNSWIAHSPKLELTGGCISISLDFEVPAEASELLRDLYTNT
jgi:hypothetical protein